MCDLWIAVRRWYCAKRYGHDFFNYCPPSCTPFVVCRRCGHGGWVL